MTRRFTVRQVLNRTGATKVIWIIGILAYIIISFVFSITIIEKQFRRSRWYDGPMTLPAVAIAWMTYFLEKHFGLNK